MEHIFGKLDVMVKLLIVINDLESELEGETESVDQGSCHSCVTRGEK